MIVFVPSSVGAVEKFLPSSGFSILAVSTTTEPLSFEIVVVLSLFSVIAASAIWVCPAIARATPTIRPTVPILTESERPSLNLRMENFSFLFINILNILYYYFCMIFKILHIGLTTWLINLKSLRFHFNILKLFIQEN